MAASASPERSCEPATHNNRPALSATIVKVFWAISPYARPAIASVSATDDAAMRRAEGLRRDMGFSDGASLPLHVSALGGQDLTNRSSEIDGQPPSHFSCEDFGHQGRERGVEAYPLHGHQTDNVSVITLASVADLSCAFSSSNTIKSNSASVIPSGRQMLTPLAN